MSIKREPRLYPNKTPGRTYDQAGRCDLIAECSGTWEGVTLEGIILLDWKSSKEPKDPKGYAEWPLQISGYREGATQSDVIEVPITGGATVRLHKLTGRPTIYDCSDSFDRDIMAFGHLVRYYKTAYSGDYQKGVPSVTTILGLLAKPSLIPWAANWVCDYVIMKAEEHYKQFGNLADIKQIKEWAEESKKNYRKVSGDAADIGKAAHKLIELDLKNKELPNMNQQPEAVANAFNAYLQFKEAMNLKPLAVEFKIYGTLRQSCGPHQNFIIGVRIMSMV